MFDLKTHIRNKNGHITSTQPYRLIINGGVQMFERPPGSGNFFYLNGEPIAKVDEKKAEKELLKDIEDKAKDITKPEIKK